LIALLQRAAHASVTVEGETVGAIGQGLCVFVCAEPDDSEATTRRLLDRLLAFRVFADAAGRMNLSLKDIGGGLLLIPQFTLAADTSRGTRPSFSSAAPPELARSLFDHLLAEASRVHSPVAAGRFGAHMQVSLVNDGPVTFWLRASAAALSRPAEKP
jgi:D-tyrosyl-tRNA(Tyr) deacylase